MASRFQAAGLVASPSYPDSIMWSEENLIAVASGSIVTILNPDLPFGHRGLIKVPARDPLPIGTVKREDLLSGSLLPICLSRDRNPCVRSVSWSPLGMAPNSGCLLAICTTEGLVKIYRPPFCDYSAEWIEIVDISEILYKCLADIGFQGFEGPSKYSEQLAEEQGCAKDLPISVCKKSKRKRGNEDSKFSLPMISEGHLSSERAGNANDVDSGSSTNAEMQETRLSHLLEIQPAHTKENESCWRHLKSHSLSLKKIKDPSVQLLTATQYASYSAMLSSLVIDWSPLLQLPFGNCAETQHCPSSFSLLAVGGKSGGISIFRVSAPQFYSVEEVHIIPTAVIIGLLQAHNAWVTAIKWLHSTDNSLNAELLLVSGAFDGSVKIWTGSSQVMKSSAVNQHHFVLLKEIISADSIPVSVLSITVPVQCPDELLLAVGRGSGSFEVWLYGRSHNKYETFGSYAAHDHIVTGLSWAFGGSCLYTCSQDNDMRCWKIRGNAIFEVSIPSSTPGQRSISDLPNAFFSCFGLAVSPGNMAIAMVRSFDVELLNPMYQERSLRAAVEYLWIGGLEQDNSSSPLPELSRELFPGFSQKNSNTWKSNILWSLKQYVDSARPLVVWDIVSALLAFKRSAPKYLESILVEWLSVCYLGSNLLTTSPATVLARVSRSYSRLSSRQLHLLNVLCRRVVLSDLQDDHIISGTQNQLKACDGEERVNLWVKLVLGSERELRHRVVFYNLSALSFMSPPSSSVTGCWYPVGVSPMKKWIELDLEENQSESYASEFQSPKIRLHGRSKFDCYLEEQCSYCSASVPFESPEYAFCRGTTDSSGKDGERHKLARCAASMQICPTTPLWFCICCHRWVSKLPPEPLFSMPGCLTDSSLDRSSFLQVSSKPFCPFCGILLQRFQPDFLLSAVPV